MRSPTLRIKETIVVLEQKYNSALSAPHALCRIRPDRGDLKHRNNAVHTKDADAYCGILVRIQYILFFCHSLCCWSIYSPLHRNHINILYSLDMLYMSYISILVVANHHHLQTVKI